MRIGHHAKVVGALFACCLLVGVGSREIYGSPATNVLSPMSWPTASTLPRATSKLTVLQFVRADDASSAHKVAELASVIAAAHHRPFVAVVHVANERPTALWDASGQIASSARLLDRGGIEARRFGASKTGHVVVYDADGVLRFAGGPSDGGLRMAIEQ